MAQADHVSNAIRALITGAGAKPSTNPVRAAHAEFVRPGRGNRRGGAALRRASDVGIAPITRRRCLRGVGLVSAILDDTAQNVPGGLDLRQDALLADLASEATGTIQRAAEALAEEVA